MGKAPGIYLGQAIHIIISKSELISLGLTTFLNGIFYVLFFITVIMTFYVRESSRQHHMRMLPVSFLMLVVATTHLFRFIVQKGGSALAFYEVLSDATSVARVICLVIQSVLGDLVIIWRLYVVYGQRFWVVIPPLLLVTCYTAVGSVAIVHSEGASRNRYLQCGESMDNRLFSMTMSSNVICSGEPTLRSRPSFIAMLICAISDPRNRGYRNAIYLSGGNAQLSALYALGVLAALVSFVSGLMAIRRRYRILSCSQIRIHVNSASNIYVYSRGPPSTGTSGGRRHGNNNTTGCDSEFTDSKQTGAIPMTVHIASRTHVLESLDSGDSAPYPLSGIDRDASAAA
ncbi:hypothetical protein BGY98DRAFT_968865 [Russula aff. rugulosa BPL654]|nr:hypothetical protein BGY98DRAFT_968865 [Russula aff. rugulosa BPL654]